jgi:hypothetical protein
MANTYLQRSISNGNRRTWTWSAWVKRGAIGATQILADNYTDSNNYAHLYFSSGNTLNFYSPPAGSWSWHPVYRDTNAWYHIVLRCDTTQGSNGDRLRLYVNGELAPANAVAGINQNQELNFNASSQLRFGARQVGSSDYFNGYMSHAHFTDGYSYAPTEFGQNDTITGQWSIKTSPNVSYGTNGYFILKDGNSVTDQSGEGNNFTVSGGTLSKTEDNPSNVFATINNLLGSDQIGSTVSFSNGNTVAEDPNGSASGVNPSFISTLGMPSEGKWYCEVQPSSFSTGSGHSIGIFRSKGDIRPSSLYSDKVRYIFADTAYYIVKYGSNDQTGLSSVSSGETVGIALDLDNGTLQYYVNGSARANQLTGINSANDGYEYFFLMDLESSSSGRYGKCSFNFGNGAFGSTQLTGTTYQDSNGQGIFKYQPPTNFLALCTKNLNV